MGRLSKSEGEDLRHKALDLYLHAGYSQKQIAELLGVTEKTVSGWKVTGRWDELKGAELMTPSKILDGLYKRVYELSQSDTLKADDISKIASAIERLKQDRTTVVNYINTFKEFDVWLLRLDPDLAKRVSEYQKRFVDERARAEG